MSFDELLLEPRNESETLPTDADPADEAEDARLSARADGAVNANARAATRRRWRRGPTSRHATKQVLFS
mgnify:CR=1 FL=1